MSEPPRAVDDPGGHPLPAGLLHDLRTPLGHIIGYSDLLLEQLEEAGLERLLPQLQKIRGAGYHLLSLMEENLRVAEPEVDSAAPARAEPDAPPPPVAFFDHRSTGDLLSEAAPGLLLVVDDIEANRTVLSHRLERQGYAVVTAVDGTEALDMLAAGSFDLVLLDVMMPGMDGYEVLRRLKADERLRHVPVVMVSALSELDSVARCIELGAEDYLAKPFHPALLQARVRTCLAKKRAHDQDALAFERLREENERLRALEGTRSRATGSGSPA